MPKCGNRGDDMKKHRIDRVKTKGKEKIVVMSPEEVPETTDKLDLILEQQRTILDQQAEILKRLDGLA